MVCHVLTQIMQTCTSLSHEQTARQYIHFKWVWITVTIPYSMWMNFACCYVIYYCCPLSCIWITPDSTWIAKTYDVMIYLKFKWAFSSVFSEIDAWIQTTELKIETFPFLKLYDIYGNGLECRTILLRCAIGLLSSFKQDILIMENGNFKMGTVARVSMGSKRFVLCDVIYKVF